jgi:hypothetical protein
MNSFANNNTTYNYSYYATRPKWLVFSKIADLYKQIKYTKSDTLDTHSLPYLNKLKQAPSLPDFLESQVKTGGKLLFKSKVGVRSKDQKGLPTQPLPSFAYGEERQGSQGRLNMATPVVTQHQHLYKKTKGSSPTVPGTTHKGRAVVALPQPFALKSRGKGGQQSGKEDPTLKLRHQNFQITNQYLFEARELLCWTSDLSFFSLRGYFSNLLKALQICRFAARNNKKVLFVKGNHLTYAHSKQLNSWLVQYRRQVVPQKLRNFICENTQTHESFFNLSESVSTFSCNNTVTAEITSKARVNNPPENKKTYSSYKNSLYNSSQIHSNTAPQIELFKHFNELNNLLNSFLITTETKKRHSSPIVSNLALDSGDPQSQYLKPGPYQPRVDHPESTNKQIPKSQKISPVGVGDLVKVRVKEAQILSEQTAAGLTVPLAGFLTNSKMTFNTLYNKSNYDFYNFVVLNDFLNLNPKITENLSGIQTNVLEEIIRFSPSNFSTIKKEDIPSQGKTDKLNIRNDQQGTSINTIYKKEKQSFEKNTLKSKHFASYKTEGFLINRKDTTAYLPFTSFLDKNSSLDMSPPLEKTVAKRNRGDQSSDRKDGTRVVTRNKDLSLPGFVKQPASHNSKGDRFTNLTTTAKKLKLLEYGFFGDILTWQLWAPSRNFLDLDRQQQKEKQMFISMKQQQKQILIQKRPRVHLCSVTTPTFFKLSKSLKKQKVIDQQLYKQQLNASHFFLKSSILKKNPTSETSKDGRLPFISPASFVVKQLSPTGLVFTPQVVSLDQGAKAKEQFNLKPGKDQNKTKTNKTKAIRANLSFKEEKLVRKVSKDQKIPMGRFIVSTSANRSINRVLPFGREGDYSKSKVKQLTLVSLGNRIKTNKNSVTSVKEKMVLCNNDIFSYGYSQFISKKKYSYKKKNSNYRSFRNKQILDTGLFHSTLSSGKLRVNTANAVRIRRYYKTIMSLNQLKQYEMFAKTPFLNNQLADIIFFISPEKNQNLVNQANSLKIPTIGIVSGISCGQVGKNYSNFSLKDSVYYPILGNPASDHFTRTIIGLFVKILRVGRYNTLSRD